MFEYLILGAIQGIAEWLPVSSEGIIVLVSSHLFENFSLSEAVRLALFLHLGTFLAAAWYLRHDVKRLITGLFTYCTAEEITKKELTFLLGSSAITAALGLPLLLLIDEASQTLATSTSAIGFIVGALLLLTGWLHYRNQHSSGERTALELDTKDMIVAGLLQGSAALPGLSRSGLTVAALLMRNITDSEALRLSFLLSLPVVLGGNIILNADTFTSLGAPEIIALLSSFIFGLLSIHALMKIARHVSWSAFTIGAGILLIIGSLL